MPRQSNPETFLGRDTVKWGNNTGWVKVLPTVCPNESTCPHYRNGDEAQIANERDKGIIHILIASYRDKLCPRTLHNAFSKASNPHRLYIRIIEQRLLDGSDLVDDASCWDRYCSDYNPNCVKDGFDQHVRTITRDSRKSKGPTDPRSKLSQMILNDYLAGNNDRNHPLDFYPVALNDFCMQIDSHMDFSHGFDASLVEMHHRTQNDYSVLSTYVAALEQNEKDPPDVPLLCMATFTSTIRNWGTKLCRFLQVPKLTNAMWGAGLSFHRCHAELNVPNDPYLDGIFDGEEGSRGIRFFTHGYDVYTPDKVVVTHDYKGHQSNPVIHTWGRKGWAGGLGEHATETEMHFMKDIDEVRDAIEIKSEKRVNLLLGIKEAGETAMAQQIRESRYGLGHKRTLQQAEEFTGLNLKERKMVENKCGNLMWVPWKEEDDDYGTSKTLGRALWNGQGSIVLNHDAPAAAEGATLTRQQQQKPAAANSRSGSGSGSYSSSYSDDGNGNAMRKKMERVEGVLQDKLEHVEMAMENALGAPELLSLSSSMMLCTMVVSSLILLILFVSARRFTRRTKGGRYTN